MDIVVPVVGTAYLALAIWLLVRFINRPSPRTRWRVCVAIGLPVFYVLSCLPALHLMDMRFLPRRATVRFYKPLVRNATENEWPMAQYVRIWRVHPGWLTMQSYLLIDGWPDHPDGVKPFIPNPDGPAESN